MDELIKVDIKAGDESRTHQGRKLERSRLSDLVPASDDLSARQELLAYWAAVKRAWKTGKVQRPVAHPCAAEALNRHGESQAAASEGRAVSDEAPIGHVQV